jgi:hypothetical protein
MQENNRYAAAVEAIDDDSLEEFMGQVNSDQGYSRQKKEDTSNQPHKNVIQIIKNKISRTRPDDYEELKATKAALYGILVRFNDIDVRGNRSVYRKQDPCKIDTFLPSKTDNKVNFSLEGLHKHKMPI